MSKQERNLTPRNTFSLFDNSPQMKARLLLGDKSTVSELMTQSPDLNTYFLHELWRNRRTDIIYAVTAEECYQQLDNFIEKAPFVVSAMLLNDQSRTECEEFVDEVLLILLKRTNKRRMDEPLSEDVLGMKKVTQEFIMKDGCNIGKLRS